MLTTGRGSIVGSSITDSLFPFLAAVDLPGPSWTCASKVAGTVLSRPIKTVEACHGARKQAFLLSKEVPRIQSSPVGCRMYPNGTDISSLEKLGRIGLAAV